MSAEHLRLGSSEELRVLETDPAGERLVVEVTYSPGRSPVRHHHPSQAEHFDVLEGVVRVDLGARTFDAKAGETIDVPAGTTHAFHNPHLTPAVLRWEVVPALDTLDFFRTIDRLVKEGKLGGSLPNPLQMSVLLATYDHVFRLESPPRPVQRLLAKLAPVARRLGYHALPSATGSTQS